MPGFVKKIIFCRKCTLPKVPEYKTAGAAGADLYAAESAILIPGKVTLCLDILPTVAA